MKIILAIFVFMCYSNCYAFDWNNFENKTGWNKEEVTLGVVGVSLHTIDWLQTLKIAKNRSEYYEKYNTVFLGKCPSKGRVNTYMGLSLIGKIGMVHFLPRDCNLWGWKIKPKRVAQCVWIGASGWNVGRNYSIGLKFGF